MIRKATASDLDAVSEIYEYIHAKEQRGELTIGWLPGVYPVRATAKAALEREDLFVYEEAGAVLAAGILNHAQMDSYADGDWRIPAADREVMVLHTLVVEPAAAQRGIGRAFVRFYEEYGRKNGCKSLRMDTNERNAVARRFYAACGYREAGVVSCDFNGIPNIHLVLLEKGIV